MSTDDRHWAVRHADTIFKIVLLALAGLWMVMPAPAEPRKPRADLVSAVVRTAP
ncbi:hypothetical protein ACJ4V0_01945 [Phreatobacter sp. HK31-P]|nr:hypothetical protein [Phreatobacter sp.]